MKLLLLVWISNFSILLKVLIDSRTWRENTICCFLVPSKLCVARPTTRVHVRLETPVLLPCRHDEGGVDGVVVVGPGPLENGR